MGRPAGLLGLSPGGLGAPGQCEHRDRRGVAFLEREVQFIHLEQTKSARHREVNHVSLHVKVVVFGFAEGEELSEHTASRPAVVQVVRGEFELTLDGQPVTVREGDWVHMAAGLRHAVRARTPAVMLLTLLQSAEGPAGG